jgi:hypothetical protein
VRRISAREKPYDAADDFAKSLNVAYSAIRQRVATGGPGWTPGSSDVSRDEQTAATRVSRLGWTARKEAAHFERPQSPFNGGEKPT